MIQRLTGQHNPVLVSLQWSHNAHVSVFSCGEPPHRVCKRVELMARPDQQHIPGVDPDRLGA